MNRLGNPNWFCDMSAGLKKYRAAIFNDAPVIQAVSSKECGNMALHTGDIAEHVIDNRQRFLGSLNLKLENLVAAEQVHSAAICVVDREQMGLGAYSLQNALPGIDALITRESGVILSIFTADCLPIFIYDPRTPAIAIVHAGWRGSIAEIAKLTINKMASEFKTNPGDCLAAIGPSICRICFKVSSEVAEKFYFLCPQVVMQSPDGYQVDLSAFNAWLLKDAGLQPERIVAADLCTGCHNNDFFSYRIEGGTMGRMMGIIALQ
jgi:uncharacterized protein, YfiH family